MFHKKDCLVLADFKERDNLLGLMFEVDFTILFVAYYSLCCIQHTNELLEHNLL